MTKSKVTSTKDLQAQQRQGKLASALRTNLRRRKAQARGRDEAMDETPQSAPQPGQADLPAKSQ
jgi:hypothetical protein